MATLQNIRSKGPLLVIVIGLALFAALSIAGQMHGLVMLDKDGNVLRNAILWCDARTQKQCDEIYFPLPGYRWRYPR